MRRKSQVHASMGRFVKWLLQSNRQYELEEAFDFHFEFLAGVLKVVDDDLGTAICDDLELSPLGITVRLAVLEDFVIWQFGDWRERRLESCQRIS